MSYLGRDNMPGISRCHGKIIADMKEGQDDMWRKKAVCKSRCAVVNASVVFLWGKDILTILSAQHTWIKCVNLSSIWSNCSKLLKAVSPACDFKGWEHNHICSNDRSVYFSHCHSLIQQVQEKCVCLALKRQVDSRYKAGQSWVLLHGV